MHTEPETTETPATVAHVVDASLDTSDTITGTEAGLVTAEASRQLTLDIPEVPSSDTDDPDDGAIDLRRFRLDEHTRELGRRQVALIKAQLAERAARRAA